MTSQTPTRTRPRFFFTSILPVIGRAAALLDLQYPEHAELAVPRRLGAVAELAHQRVQTARLEVDVDLLGRGGARCGDQYRAGRIGQRIGHAPLTQQGAARVRGDA